VLDCFKTKRALCAFGEARAVPSRQIAIEDMFIKIAAQSVLETPGSYNRKANRGVVRMARQSEPNSLKYRPDGMGPGPFETVSQCAEIEWQRNQSKT
jgi:hypothetical protein